MFAPAFRTSALGLALGLALAATAARGAADKEEKNIELKVGDAAPAFVTRTDGDTTWESVDRFGKKWVVIYFVI